MSFLTPLIAQADVNAQIVPTQYDAGTITQQNQNTINISGGTTSANGSNLFHSFSQFNVNAGQVANFLSTPNTQNILGRINGGSASLINGALQITGSNANLFLMNPAGIVFGANASLNLPASFTATTATGINFNNGQFNAIGNNDYTNLFGNPTAFTFGLNQPGSIVNGGNLSVNSGQNINLIGGTVVSTGTVNAPTGNVNIAAVPGTSLVRISQPGNLLSLEIPGAATVNFTPATLPQLLTGTGILGITVAGNNVNLDRTNIPINPGDVVVNKLGAGTATVAAANNLNLIGSNVKTTGDLTLRAQDTVAIKDTKQDPVNIAAGQKLLIQGDKKVDIFALNNPQTNISASGDLLLRSITTIGGDAYFNAGGNFRIEQLDGKLGGLFSPYDPIIRASGDVSFASYNGASLHIIAGGSVNITGDIIITGPDGPFSAFSGSGLEEKVIVNGIPKEIEINGKTTPTLDIRAGTTNIGTPGITDSLSQITPSSPIITIGNPTGITPSSPSISTSGTPTGSSITVGGDIKFVSNTSTPPTNTPAPVVLLTNQYFPSNLTPGDINVNGQINTIYTQNGLGGAVSTPGTSGPPVGLIPITTITNGGDITIVGRKDITVNQLTTGTANAINLAGISGTGNIIVKADGNIKATNVSGTGLISTENLRDTSGNIELTSTNGVITTDRVSTQLGSSNFAGTKAGDIKINASGTISTKSLETGSLSTDANHTGGNISLISTNGSIITANLFTGITNFGNSGTVNATAKTNLTTGNIITTANNGNGGNIDLTSTGGQITTQQVASKAINGTTVNAKSGDINLTAAGAIATKDLDTRSQTAQIIPSGSGNIKLTSTNGSIDTTTISTNTGNIILKANGDLNATGLLSSENLRGGTGNISLTSDSGKITTDRVATQLSASNFTTAKAGDINLKAAQAILVKNNIDSGSLSNDASHTGGNITLESTNSSIDTGNLTTNMVFGNNSGTLTANAKTNLKTGNISTNTKFGNGGKVTLNSGNDITVDSIDTSANPRTEGSIEGSGNGGAVDITATRFFLAKNSITIPAVGNTPASLASIYTNGNTPGGAITIRHGGNGITPFVIGNATTNGTKDSIVSSNNNALNPQQSLLASTTQGNIQIITGTPPTPPVVVIPPVVIEKDLPPKCPPNCPQETSKQKPIIDKQPNPIVDPAPVEITISKDFGDLKPFNKEKPQDILRKIQNSTGVKPAIIYATFSPPNLGLEIAKDKNTISELARNNFQLDLVLVSQNGEPVRHTIPVSREKMLQTVKQFRKEVTNPKNATAFMPTAQQLYQWLIAPLESDLKQRGIQNLVFIMDSGLRGLPMAALHDGKQFLIERYSVGSMPSIGLADTRYVDIRKAKVLAMGAENTPDQAPLPAVPVELKTIASTIWNGKSLENDQFTATNLVAQRQQQPFGILHLATHGEFKPGGPENSYIQFKNERLGFDRFRQLKLNEPPVELMVLSACRTALGDEDAELGFAGSAARTGVKSVMGSLWYVSDEGTLGLMTSFYRNLQTAPIKAEALRQTQVAMLKGKVRLQQGKLISGNDTIDLPPSLLKLGDVSLTHPFYWSAFTIVGNPW